MSLEIRELNTVESMLAEISVIQQLYPKLTLDHYKEMLIDMLPNNYGQVAVFEDGICLGISGYWLGTKLWCGKYLELDNVVVHSDHRSKGIGKILSDYLQAKAEEIGCTILVLDAYTHNFGAHRFYYNQGFGPKGFHFIKVLNEEGLT
jgi:GNAT superfamily N-acetyltransferase